MNTLECVGAVVRDSHGDYRPGLLLAAISRNIAAGELLRLEAKDALAKLLTRLRGVIHLGVFEYGMVTYAAMIGTSVHVRVPSQVGARSEPYCSALGTVLLSGLCDEQLDEYLHRSSLIARTPQTITDRSNVGIQLMIGKPMRKYAAWVRPYAILAAKLLRRFPLRMQPQI